MSRRGGLAAAAVMVGCSTVAGSSGTEDSWTGSGPATATTHEMATTWVGGTGDVTGAPTTSTGGTTGLTSPMSSSSSSDTTFSPEGCGAEVPSGPRIVHTTAGAIEGVAQGETVAFLGVRYAEPPTGEGRFRPPQPRACAPGLTPADTKGPMCPQVEKNLQGMVTAMYGEEDCLTLNVWTPQVDAGARPVLVFIHGGGNAAGSASDPLYDGAALAAAQDVVVVTLEYRLGALGFLTHPALADESDEGVSGNYGLLDQILALQWVQDNIAGFGGDPGRVLLFGESAGAVDACSLIGSPRAAGLFQRAIVQSGACRERELAKYEADIAGPWVTASGCAQTPNVAACLRELTLAEILTLQPDGYPSVAGLAQGWGPHVDGVVVPKTTLSAMAEGTHNAMPLMFGANRDETANTPITLTVPQYEALVQANFGVLANMVLAVYPASDYGDDGTAAYVALTSDVKFICNARRAARAADAGQDAPVFRYHFAYDAYDPGPNMVQAAFHGLELVYIFANWGVYSPNAGDLSLSQRLQEAWVRFAATGDPAGAELPWPAYVSADDNGALLDEPPDLFNGVRTVQCDFWDMWLP